MPLSPRAKIRSLILFGAAACCGFPFQSKACNVESIEAMKSPHIELSALSANSSNDAASAQGELVSPPSALHLPEDERASLGGALSEARRAVTAVTGESALLKENEGVSHVASNNGQNLLMRFGAGKPRIEATRAGRNWAVTMGFQGGSDSQAVAQGSQAEYRHTPEITEWWKNQPEGIEHGFVLQEGHGLDGCRVPVTVDGATVESDGKGGLSIIGKDGAPLLAYTGLKVWDATGRTLPATMTAVAGGIELAVVDTGASYPITIDPLITSVEKRIQSPNDGDGTAGDRFGFSVSLDGDRALVGAPFADDAGESSGSAYIFKNVAGSWTLEAELVATDAAASDFFGNAVSLDGDRALVGAYGDSGAGVFTGSAYIFVRSGATWTQEAKLTAADAAANDNFGSAVSLAGDVAVVGSYLDDDKGTSSGSAYIYSRNGGTWALEKKLTAPDGLAFNQFAFSVSLDGERLLVGASRGTVAGVRTGSAYLFLRNGGMWTLEQRLTATNPSNGGDFGSSVSLDGTRALVGASLEYDPERDRGAAYLFTKGDTTWALEAKLRPSVGVFGDRFGNAVSLDGDIALVGAFRSDSKSIDKGAAYVYVRRDGTWPQEAILTADDARFGEDYFGLSVSLDGNRALISADQSDYNLETQASAPDQGSAYFFILSNDSPASSFDQWAAGKRLTGDAALLSSDPDKDGRTNLEEFAFGGDPSSGADNNRRGGPANAGVESYFTFTLPIRAGAVFSGSPLTATIDGISYTVLADDNLGSGDLTVVEREPLTIGLPPIDGYEYRSFRLAVTISERPAAFIRLRVSVVP